MARFSFEYECELREKAAEIADTIQEPKTTSQEEAGQLSIRQLLLDPYLPALNAILLEASRPKHHPRIAETLIAYVGAEYARRVLGLAPWVTAASEERKPDLGIIKRNYRAFSGMYSTCLRLAGIMEGIYKPVERTPWHFGQK